MYNYIKSKINRSIRIPKDRSGLITYNPKDESPPPDAGMNRKEVSAIWAGIE